MSALLPKWAMGDPAMVYERLEGIKHKPPRLSRQEEARKGLEQLFSEEHMTKDESEQLEELLMTWYHWAKAHREHLGHSRVAPGFHGVSDLDAYGDDDETDAKLNRYIAEQVDVCLNTLSGDYRSAIGITLGNKDAQACVYRNPRWSSEQTHRLYQEAKDRLIPMLRKRDMIKVIA